MRTHERNNPDDEELLRRSHIREDEFERNTFELERERGEARDLVAVKDDTYPKLEETWLKKTSTHDRMKRVAIRPSVATVAPARSGL